MSELPVMIEHQLKRLCIGDGPISNENRPTDLQLSITVIYYHDIRVSLVMY